MQNSVKYLEQACAADKDVCLWLAVDLRDSEAVGSLLRVESAGFAVVSHAQSSRRLQSGLCFPLLQIPAPTEVIDAAWSETVNSKVVGSSTALVAHIDSVRSA